MLDAGRPLTVAELADRWQCSRQHVHNLIGRGDLAVARIGRLVRISWEEIDRCERSGTGAHGTPHGQRAAEPAASRSAPRIVGLPNGLSAISSPARPATR